MRPDFKKMNNMIPAIVQDYQTKQVLMMAYVNEEAYDKMLETKETYFYSRSRNELWHKGETSGHYQYIKGMYLDCDQDTLLIYVEQVGAACHTGSYSCFFEEVIRVILHLFRYVVQSPVYILFHRLHKRINCLLNRHFAFIKGNEVYICPCNQGREHILADVRICLTTWF